MSQLYFLTISLTHIHFPPSLRTERIKKKRWWKGEWIYKRDAGSAEQEEDEEGNLMKYKFVGKNRQRCRFNVGNFPFWIFIFLLFPYNSLEIWVASSGTMIHGFFLVVFTAGRNGGFVWDMNHFRDGMNMLRYILEGSRWWWDRIRTLFKGLCLGTLLFKFDFLF